jgi:hypothetical protein
MQRELLVAYNNHMPHETRTSPHMQSYPLEVNPRRGEPFLRLKHHKNIISTRSNDMVCCPPILTDPQVWGGR